MNDRRIGPVALDRCRIVHEVNWRRSNGLARFLRRDELREEKKLEKKKQTHAGRKDISAEHMGDAVRHLYVHFPFCARICPYCAFYKTRGNAEEVATFCRALTLEAERAARHFPLQLETISFGGGTPSALSTPQLTHLLSVFRATFDLSHLQEWSMEVNPGSVSAGKAAALHAAGLDRISLGVQSWDDDLLRLLGREHDARQAEESFRLLRHSGFINLSIDLMFALPGQSEKQWRETLERTVDLGPEHISTYCLTYEEDTDFLARFNRGEWQRNEETEARFLDLTMTTLEAAGYEHYEISNYGRPGFRSLHNQAYWRGADYLGLGPSAFSTIADRRWQNIADHRAYAGRLDAHEPVIGEIEALSFGMRRTERIALGLRTDQGIAEELISTEDARDLIDAGLLSRRRDRLVLTRNGRMVADAVAEELI